VSPAFKINRSNLVTSAPRHRSLSTNVYYYRPRNPNYKTRQNITLKIVIIRPIIRLTLPFL